MNSLAKSIEIKYLAVDRTLELDSTIKNKFTRLKKVCEYIINCQIKIVNIAHHRKTKKHFSYMVSMNITMPEGYDIYTLRVPANKDNESIEKAISDVFAMTYRKLIEVKLENKLSN